MVTGNTDGRIVGYFANKPLTYFEISCVRKGIHLREKPGDEKYIDRSPGDFWHHIPI
jgi:hypothetical protein